MADKTVANTKEVRTFTVTGWMIGFLLVIGFAAGTFATKNNVIESPANAGVNAPTTVTTASPKD